MQGAHPFFTYTTEILAWRLGRTPDATSVGELAVPAKADPGRARAKAARIVRAARDARDIVLLGLGRGETAAALAEVLPPDKFLTVLSADPAAAAGLRAADRLGWFAVDGRARLVADSSRQALLCLPLLAGWDARDALVVVNPEPCPPVEREALAWVRRMLAGCAPLPAPGSSAKAPSGSQADAPTDDGPGPAPGSLLDAGPDVSAAAPAPTVTLAVLVRPGEPGLAAFFAACAGLADAAVLCWDAADIPEAAALAAALDMPVRHLARPLRNDFAAQRNALLAACPPGWVLTLDPDERPGPGFRQAIARLTRTPGLGAAYFPRLTLYPDAGHVKIGHGLWPDLQLRLFRKAGPDHPRYVRPVHERLDGLCGRAALALDAPLVHHNRLLADDGTVTAKLAAYDAAGGAPRHHLSPDYPTLPLAFFTALIGKPVPGRVLLLPELW